LATLERSSLLSPRSWTVSLAAPSRTPASAARDRARLFNIGWVTLCWPQTPIEAGQCVGILIPLYGLWSLNACRVIYTLDAADAR